MNLLTVLLAVIVFLVVIWLLIAVLLFARKKLVPDKKVKIQINQKKIYETECGCTLLQSLSEEKIYVPSACGGQGTCGTCKGIIVSGGGDLLPTEKVHIDRKLAEQQVRLFCQVKVKNDMEIEIAPEILGVKKWECEVISNKSVATYIKELVIKLPDNEKLQFKSGSYIQIDAPKMRVDFQDVFVEDTYKEEWEKYHLFKFVMKNSEITTRAYSIANSPEDKDTIVLNIRIALPPFDKKKNRFKKINPGIVSSYIYSLKPGDKVVVSGPYGEFFLQETDNEKMFIGGGAGMAPLRSHILHLFHTLQTKNRVTFWYGGRSLQELFYQKDFEKIAQENPNFSFHVALSEPKNKDNWSGFTGFIHQVILEQYLQKHKTPENIEYYICGPPLMLQAVLKMLDHLGVPQNMIYYDDFGN